MSSRMTALRLFCLNMTLMSVLALLVFLGLWLEVSSPLTKTRFWLCIFMSGPLGIVMWVVQEKFSKWIGFLDVERISSQCKSPHHATIVMFFYRSILSTSLAFCGAFFAGGFRELMFVFLFLSFFIITAARLVIRPIIAIVNAAHDCLVHEDGLVKMSSAFLDGIIGARDTIALRTATVRTGSDNV